MSARRLLVPVFVPYEIVKGKPLSADYDTAEFRADLGSWFAPLAADWEWVAVTPANTGEAVAAAAAAARERPVIVLNLCDGTDEDGFPGLSVVRALEAAGLAFTGADIRFYELSTSKLAMKRRFAATGVATSPWMEIRDIDADLERAASMLGWPLFLKPDISAGSVGISQRSLVKNHDQAARQTRALLAGMHGARFDRCGVYAENFLSGREFTVLLQSEGRAADKVVVYPPCERVFHSALPVEERFLSFERYWELYDQETPPPSGEPYYRHVPVEPPALAAAVCDTARRAYAAVGGCGYARVDLRLQGDTGEINVLEVNANCGLSSDDQSSAGAILGMAGIALSEVLRLALRDAWLRRHDAMEPPL